VNPIGVAVLVLPVGAILENNAFELTDLSGSLSATSHYKNHTWDLDFGQAINVGCNFNFRLFAGLRYSKLEHRLDTANTVAASGVLPIPVEEPIVLRDITFGVLEPKGSIVGPTIEGDMTLVASGENKELHLSLTLEDNLQRKSRFEGLGPRLGVDLNYQFCGGFGLVGSLATALLVGNVNNVIDQHLMGSGVLEGSDGVTGIVILDGSQTDHEPAFPLPAFSLDQTVNNHHPKETRVVPNIEAKLGLDYTYLFCNCSRTALTVEAGYQVSHYFNAIDKFDLLNPISGFNNTLDVSFDGPYLSVQVAL
jgi:hypothetical protein